MIKVGILGTGFGKTHATSNIDELITDPDIDLIDICLPTSIHKEYVLKPL